MAISQTNLAVRAFKAFMAMPRGEQVFTALSGTAIAGAGVALGPVMLMADDGVEQAPQSRVVVESGMPSDSGQRALVEGIVAMLASCRTIIGEHDGAIGGGSSSISLWEADAEDIGTVNLTEIMSIGHNTLLQTLTVYMAPDGPPDAPAPRWLTYADDPVAAWRTTPGLSASVIATGVTELRVSRSPETGGSATVRLGLTWASGLSDESTETVLAVTLPAFVVR